MHGALWEDMKQKSRVLTINVLHYEWKGCTGYTNACNLSQGVLGVGGISL